MKVFILALDGLEYNLVEKWDLMHLKQVHYGKINMGEQYFGLYEKVPYTPTVWTSFITGKPPSVHGVRELYRYNSNFLEGIRHKPPFVWIGGLSKILRFFGIRKRYVTKQDWKRRLNTIFDEVKPSIALFVPAYNPNTQKDRNLQDAMSTGNLEKIERVINEAHEWRVHKVLNIIKKTSGKWCLFMACFGLADWVGHVWIVKHIKKVKKAYQKLNMLAYNLKRLVPENTIFLIVSDHGMQPSDDGVTGTHSKHAFWSLNIDTNWRPKDITDFYPKIIEWTKAETTKQFQVK